MTEEKIDLYISKQRLSSYDDDIFKHKENLEFIGSITGKIALLEICVRNVIDHILSEHDSEWLRHYEDETIQDELRKLQKNVELSHHQLLSRLTLGKIILILHKSRLENQVFKLKDIDFKIYDESNRNFYRLNGKKAHFSNANKTKIMIALLRNLRNRCFHWENLFKITINKHGEFPRITTKLQGTNIGIHPSKIKLFLEELLKTFDKDLIDLC